jgi:hypothetical protein
MAEEKPFPGGPVDAAQVLDDDHAARDEHAEPIKLRAGKPPVGVPADTTAAALSTEQLPDPDWAMALAINAVIDQARVIAGSALPVAAEVTRLRFTLRALDQASAAQERVMQAKAGSALDGLMPGGTVQ